jgi:hypothetical protein
MKRLLMLVIVAALALVVASPAAANNSIKQPTAHVAKKKCKKKKKKCKKKKAAPAPYIPPAAPANLALTESEVRSAVNQAAYNYCLPDIYCYDYGIYVDYSGGPISCASKSTYEWNCYGWNDEFDGFAFYSCDFREIVDRVGYSGLSHRQDSTYGNGGWLCY